MAAPIKFGVGQSVLRKEDDALIRGKGRYTDDHAPQPALHALVLRSPHAHAKFTINATRARGLPGVSLILTSEDVRDLGCLPCLFNLEVESLHRRRPIRSSPMARCAMSAMPLPSSSPTRSTTPAMRWRRSRSTGRRCRRWPASSMPSRRARRRSGPTMPATCCSTCRSATRRPPRPRSPRRMRWRKFPSSIRASSPISWKRARRSANTTPGTTI